MRNKFFSSPWFALSPALLIVSVLLGASLAYSVAESLGLMAVIGQDTLSLDAYHNLLFGQGLAGQEFWGSFGFSLWISVTSTLISAAAALALALWFAERGSTHSGLNTFALNWNMAFPHLVWAVAFLLVLSQSGLFARWAVSLGWIHSPADFPVLVRDRFGIGIILDYVSKEIPFLTLIILAILRAQPVGYGMIAENLGANRWQRLRYIILPLVMPALLAGSLLVFAFIFSSYQVPALLGVGYPRMLPVLALRFFSDPDLRSRADGMAISLDITLVVLAVAALSLRHGEREL